MYNGVEGIIRSIEKLVFVEWKAWYTSKTDRETNDGIKDQVYANGLSLCPSNPVPYGGKRPHTLPSRRVDGTR